MTASRTRPDSRASRKNREPIRIGRWVLYPDTGLLRSDEGDKRLSGKPLHVLLVLIDAGGSAVSRDDLLHAVWGENYPSDAVVSRAIADLRGAFGETAGDGETIRTIPKFGYQLVLATRDAPAAEQPPKISAGRWLAVLAALALLAYLLLSTTPDTAEIAGFRMPPAEPLTAAPGIEHQPRFVPGSDWVVYAALRPGQGDWDLFRVLLNDNMTQAVAATPGVSEHGPAVSPDGESVAYVRLTGDACEVVEQPIVLGAPRFLAHCTNKFATLVDWSPDGSTLAFTSREADDADGFRRIHTLNRLDGAQRQLSTGVSPTGSDFYPRYSPSGQQLAFLRGEPQPDHRSSLWIVEISSGRETRISAQPAQLGGMTWLNEASLLYSINDAGKFELRRHVIETGAEDVVDSGDLIHPHFDRSGGRLVAAFRQSERDLAIVSAASDTLPVASSTSDDHHARWSPDGRFIAFVSRRSGHDELWLAASDAQEARRLTRFDGATVRYPAWHPDAQRILFTVQTDAREQLFEINLISGQVGPVASASPGATTPSFMPDGLRWVYGCGETVADSICVGDRDSEQHLAGGYFRPIPVATDEIIVLDLDARLVRMRLDGTVAGIVWDGLPADGRFAWDITADSLVYAVPAAPGNGGRVVRRELRSGEETELYEGSMPLADGSIDALPGGAVVITRFDAASDDLVWISTPLAGP